MLKIAAPCPAFVDDSFFIADAVIVGIPVKEDIVRVRLADQHAIIERKEETGQLQFVGKNTMLVKDAVVPARPVHRDTARWLQFAGTVDVLHVSGHLCDKQAAVAVKGHRHRFGDIRFAQDQFHVVAGRQLE